jgi:DnaJ like chaperone protein
VYIRFPNLGCLWFLLLLGLVGGGPLLVGLARVGLFLVAVSLLAGTVGSWFLRRRAVENQGLFEETLVYLLVRLAEADGSLDRREVTVIRQFFQRDLGYGPDKLERIRRLIHEARGSSVTVADLCARLRQRFSLHTCLLVVELLGRIAQADGQVSQKEAALLDEITRLLDLGPFRGSFQWFQYREGFSYGGQGEGPRPPAPDRVEEALAVLGLQRGAGPDEIKQAWRRLSKEHHPDRVTHLGEELRRVAEERMRRINAAYDTLKAAGMAR